MLTASASIRIERPIAEVFAAIADVTRTGEWSPECTAGRWVAPATAPALGASFEGDNIAKLGPITLKRWTTTSEVTELVPNEVFEFVSGELTTWRYEFVADAGATKVTESFSYAPFSGIRGLLYKTRPASMTKGMETTLASVKAALEV